MGFCSAIELSFIKGQCVVHQLYLIETLLAALMPVFQELSVMQLLLLVCPRPTRVLQSQAVHYFTSSTAMQLSERRQRVTAGQLLTDILRCWFDKPRHHWSILVAAVGSGKSAW